VSLRCWTGPTGTAVYFHRLLSRTHTRLYTEMVTTGALRHGDLPPAPALSTTVEHPVALQLGGSEPQELATCRPAGRRSGAMTRST
jgi:tRNA-dihydrouridine synthase A